MIIRGSRVLDLLNETTYAELERNTLNFEPDSDKRENVVGAVQVTGLELLPYVPNGALEAQAEINSGGNKYQSIIFFRGVDFQDEDTPQNVSFTGADGQEYHCQPISLHQHNVQVRCTCLDFRWRFSIYNQKDGSLYGEGPGVYIPKTNRPPNNRKGVPGLCKHLIKVAVELQQTGLVKN